MSTATLISEGIPDLVPQLHRSPGLHISHIIHSICITHGIYEPSSEGLNMTKAQLGLALEQAIISRYQQTYPEKYTRVPEQCEVDKKSGLTVFGHPDLFDKPCQAVDEIKLTWLSAGHLISSNLVCEECGLPQYNTPSGMTCDNGHGGAEGVPSDLESGINGQKFWRFWCQVMAYCYMMGVDLGRLHICFIQGNYRDIQDPIYKVFERRFEESELVGNWSMLMKWAKNRMGVKR